MPTTQRNFIAGRMNKSVDERLVPNGEYIDGLNVRLGSTEQSEIGSVENSKGNEKITALEFNNVPLSNQAKCIGSFEDGQRETIIWFVHDPAFPGSPSNILDLIVSFNVVENVTTYHAVSVNDGSQTKTTLDFNPQFLITGVNRVEDLLFFTDNINPPRFINLVTGKTLPNGVPLVDSFTAEELLVIKKPPSSSPKITLQNVSGEENFLEERYLSFAYRYQYADGEYSALSQFSDIAFQPSNFSLETDSGLNEGMKNVFNSVKIEYNTGSELVKDVEVVFKESTSGVIKSIEKFNKFELGLANNTDYEINFTNSKIFTVLPNTELVRLYDNVPIRAKAQTIMGNRLVYGNYVDGFDLLDKNTNPVKFEYSATLISEEIGLNELEDEAAEQIYTVDAPINILNGRVNFDLDGLELKQGATLNLEVRFGHSTFGGQTPFPAEQTDQIDIALTFILPQDFNSVYELATDPAFAELVGTSSNIKPVFDPVPGNPTSCDGFTFTDQFNCAVPNNLDSLTKFASGVTSTGQAIQVYTSPGSNEIGFSLLAMEFVDDTTTPTQRVYEYYDIVTADGTYTELGNPKSLHSNRDYEIGIVYMDEFNRSTTALVSPLNTIHVPCSLSSLVNKVQISIPPTQLAPVWASKYKFVIKPDMEDYETIFTNVFFNDPTTNETLFLLQGENARKVEEGDRLIVKRDTEGPTERCNYATVLEKSAQTKDFLDPAPTDADGNDLFVPAGTYMRIKANDFNVIQGDLPTIAPGVKKDTAKDDDAHPIVRYPVNIEDPNNAGAFIDYTIPAGSRVNMSWYFNRPGIRTKCERRRYTLEIDHVSAQNYDNFVDFFNGENIAPRLNTGTAETKGEADCPPPYFRTQYIQQIATNKNDIPTASCTYYFKFFRDTQTNETLFMVTGTNTCRHIGSGSRKRRASVEMEITVIRAESTIVFETLPQDATPDLWYESSQSYDIDTTTGHHSGNVQSQTDVQSAIIDTAFFNCYAFGNGVESYKIRDSIIGKEFALGERTASTSEVDFKEAHRFADLTYSGVYNDESNVNKLNEFNLGLLNFKPLEDTFGSIQKLDGRETDILVLQEDKISYVLTGKNLLSDSTGGGQVASVPEVLGTQIARIEEYGISKNPESYVQWGFDKYFTDSKRGVVLKLSGSGQSEQLTVISEFGLRSYFRDLFIASPDTQKLGGYDPYMNEYVISSNMEELPDLPLCFDCDLKRTFNLEANNTVEYCVDVGQLVGNVAVDVIIDGSATVTAEYNGTTNSSNSTGTINIDKNVVDKEEVNITIVPTTDSIVSVVVNCPVADVITIVQVCLTNATEAEQLIHNEYRWVDGTFVSPLHSEQVQFIDDTASIVVSQFESVTGPQGAGVIPADGASVSIISRKDNTDDFVFDPSQNEFRVLRTNTVYNTTPASILSLLNASDLLTTDTSQAPIAYKSSFIMPTTGDYLYLIYDYRKSVAEDLCYSTVDLDDVCCNCTGTP